MKVSVEGVLPRLTYKADTSKLGYVRLSSELADAELPREWRALAYKLMIFCMHKLDLQNPWGVHRAPLLEVQAFVGGATPAKIREALSWMTSRPIRIKQPIDLVERMAYEPAEFTVLRECDFDHNITGVTNTEMTWTMNPAMVTAMVVDVDVGYGRAQLDVVRKLRSFPALRLYAWFTFIGHSRKKPHQWIFTTPEIAVFLGRAPDTRWDNLRDRYIEPAMAELKAARVFADVGDYHRAVYHRDQGRGRAFTAIHFLFHLRR